MKFADILTFFNPAGWPFMAAFMLATLLLSFLGWPFFVLGALLTAWCFYFFRDPARVTPVRPGLIVSRPTARWWRSRNWCRNPCSVSARRRARASASSSTSSMCMSIACRPTAWCARVFTGPEKFFNASLDKASDDNERMALVLQLTGDHPGDNKTLGVVQIAGLIARRIVCLAQEGDSFQAGQRYGIIRFGSRTDIYLPPGVRSLGCGRPIYAGWRNGAGGLRGIRAAAAWRGARMSYFSSRRRGASSKTCRSRASCPTC